ncbi:P-type conjugative transfer protein TrbL [uncultured Bartonella sp.]|uniref:P-type conjugative transfer protein TrbL n=1 Tax=uncultured Bartonella sp. TaxID=104108 RepID=UPI0026156F40|nr:P-type conjugative transfer protein TrbL [uncultured Bartonella sp.]
MNDVGVIDRFLNTFSKYIDSGLGLLSDEVKFIAATLIVIDLTLAFLFWAWGNDENILQRLVKKTLYIGSFAFIINFWGTLSTIIYQSFAGLGLKAAGSGYALGDLMKPGKVAQFGLDAANPLAASMSDLMGPYAFFENFLQITCIMLALIFVVAAFFILAIQLFISLMEFKLTTLAGFVLIPFGLFGKSAFMAEKVLGNVISSGIKVMVIAVIIGIGSTIFAEFTNGFGGPALTIDQCLTVILASLSLLGLSIFGPKIADGLVSGGPQMGAGSAAATGMMVGMGGAAAVGLAATGVGAAASATGAAARGLSAAAGGARLGYALGSAGETGGKAVLSGLGNAAKTGAAAAVSPLRKVASGAAISLSQAHVAGMKGAYRATGGTLEDDGLNPSPKPPKPPPKTPSMSQAANTAGHALKSGDSSGNGNSINLKESD